MRLQFPGWSAGVFEVTNGRTTLWWTFRHVRDTYPSAASRAFAIASQTDARNASERLNPTMLTELVERLRPTQQPIGCRHQVIAVPLLHMGELDMEPEFADETKLRRSGDHLVVLDARRC